MKTGAILMNLGSPNSTSVKDVRSYLNTFLMDKRVIDIPAIPRTILVKGIIVPFRAPKSAAAYRTIWMDEGSPLIVHTTQLQKKVAEKTKLPITVAMRYGNPTATAAYKNLLEQSPDLETVILCPLYPHYAMSSYETAVEQMKQVYKKNKFTFQLKIVPPFYQHAAYIKALTASIAPYTKQGFDKILFSYHGLPQRHLKKTDVTKQHCFQVANCCNVAATAHQQCYRHQCFVTTKLVTQALSIPEAKMEISFQSRLGKGWLEPFTDVRFNDLPKEGVKKLLVVCPAFISDCLETLEEIALRGKHSFLQAGGTSFTMIPCLNTNDLWVDACAQLIKETNK